VASVRAALGTLLVRSGQPVRMIGRPGQVEAIRRDGLAVDGCLGEFGVRADAAETLTAPPDLALPTVKTQDVTGAVRAERRSQRRGRWSSDGHSVPAMPRSRPPPAS
jgi:ketopantoate reductase